MDQCEKALYEAYIATNDYCNNNNYYIIYLKISSHIYFNLSNNITKEDASLKHLI